MSDEFTVVTFGESVAWGQGLRHAQKVPSIIFETRSARPCGPLDRDLIKARSGAVVEGASQSPLPRDINRWGRHEVPRGAPAIAEQVRTYPERDDPPPEDVDAVVVVAGINDVGVNTILDPTTDYQDLRQQTERHLFGTVRDLLFSIVEKFPTSEVLVGGYYPLLTEASEPPPMEAFEEALNIEHLTPGQYSLVGQIWDRVVANAEFFHRHQLWMLTRVVAEVDSQTSSRLLSFVHPGFSPENGIWGERALAFGPLDEDPARNVRVPACQRAHGDDAFYSGTPLEPIFNTELVRCEIASTGHPNQAGARRYAETALRRGDQRRTVNLRDLLTEVFGASDEPLVTREVLDRYGLDAEEGLRSLVSFRELDCLAVRLDTGSIRIEFDLDVLPDWLEPFMDAIREGFERVAPGVGQPGIVPTDGELTIGIDVHNWAAVDAFATLEIDLENGETVVRPFDDRGHDLIPSPATSPVYTPMAGAIRTDVAVHDPMFDEPRGRIPLAAIDGFSVHMADLVSVSLEELVRPVFERLSLPADALPLEAAISTVWDIEGLEIDADGRRVFRRYEEKTLENGERWRLDYPA